MGQNTDLQMFPDCCDDGAIPALQLIGLKLPCLVLSCLGRVLIPQAMELRLATENVIEKKTGELGNR